MAAHDLADRRLPRAPELARRTRQREVVLSGGGREGDRRVQGERAVVVDVHFQTDPLSALGTQLVAGAPERGAPDPAALPGAINHKPIDAGVASVACEAQRSDGRPLQLDDHSPLARQIQALSQSRVRRLAKSVLEQARDDWKV